MATMKKVHGFQGKTILAKHIPTILPPLTPEESLETTWVANYPRIG
jgi:predicted ATPase with chaperone activity